MTRNQLQQLREHANRSGKFACIGNAYGNTSEIILAGTSYLYTVGLLTGNAQLEILHEFRTSYEVECQMRNIQAYAQE